jgi:hypothetical protein
MSRKRKRGKVRRLSKGRPGGAGKLDTLFEFREATPLGGFSSKRLKQHGVIGLLSVPALVPTGRVTSRVGALKPRNTFTEIDDDLPSCGYSGRP